MPQRFIVAADTGLLDPVYTVPDSYGHESNQGAVKHGR